MNTQTHFFIAVPIETEQKKRIHHWVTENRNNLPFKSWVHPEDYHITLAFLGHVESKDQLSQLSKRVSEKTEDIQPFTLSLKGLDTFGKKDSPRIFWAGVEESSSLHYVQKQVFQACKDAGFKLDTKPFRPHITLARRWKTETPFIKPEAFEHTFRDDSNTFTVQKIHLYQTHLDRVPKYETVGQFALYGVL
ncbi:hypothetical protein WQ54_13460 [Bacillus sp. SA1-12]|uniref:RNA 2',3'-cyclic phosphodiesterase n=1 Tax=Bacillus sp. SA1-12 TaxID=1455638 RepID=UPI0006264E16|nr:RNA 2',3'-cyclic phosphodiesterase [Bacillus sp. SA1-12]KKI91630.1 hypothetical protein WQ54_13460 [Bacillus sp. SA1-12]